MSINTDVKTDVVLCMAPPFAPSMPPIGLGYLNAFLKSKNINSIIFDINIELYNTLPLAKKNLWQIDISDSWSDLVTVNDVCPPQKREEIVDSILAKNPKVIGFSVNCANKFFTLLLVDALRKRKVDVFIVLGGPGCFYQTDRDFFPENLIDAFVVGEGEISFYELFEGVVNKIDLLNIPGVLIPTAPEKFVSRNLIDDLDILPYPDINDFKIDSYCSKSLPIMFSRGCINRCAFCSDYLVWSGKYRTRSAESVIAEIENNSSQTGIKDVVFYDLTINGNLLVLENFCDILIKKGSDFKFTANICVRKEMDSNFLKKMKNSGFFALYWGIESGSDKILQEMKKNFTKKEAALNLKEASLAGILNYVNFIIGFPKETDADFTDTIEFFKENSEYIIGINNVNQCHLVAHTYIFKNYEKYSISNHTAPNWSENTNTLPKRKQNKNILLNTINEYGKKIFNDGKLAALDNTLKPILTTKPEALVILAPFFSTKTPNKETAYLLGTLKKLGVDLAFYDFNMHIYQNASEKNKTLWQQHNATKWTQNNNILDILEELEIDSFTDYFTNLDAEYFIFPINIFNFYFVKKLCDFVLKTNPAKKIILADICSFYDFKNSEKTHGIEVKDTLDIAKLFAKKETVLIENIAPDYFSFSKGFYEENTLIFNSVADFTNTDSNKYKAGETFLFNKLLDCSTQSLTGLKWGSYVYSDNNVYDIIKSKPSFVKIKIAPDAPSKKNIYPSMFSLLESASVIREFKEKNIPVFLELIVGLPGETKDIFSAFCEFLKQHIGDISGVDSVDKFIPNLSFYKHYKDYNIQVPKQDKLPLLWIDNLGNNDYLRTLRVYMILKILRERNKSEPSSNINFSIPYKDKENIFTVAASIGEILEYKNQEVIDLNTEKRILAKEINEAADKRIAKLAADKDAAVNKIAKKNEADFQAWETKFIAEVSKRDEQLKDLFIQKDVLNEIIDSLEKENTLIKNSLWFKFNDFLKSFPAKIFFLKDK